MNIRALFIGIMIRNKTPKRTRVIALSDQTDINMGGFQCIPGCIRIMIHGS